MKQELKYLKRFNQKETRLMIDISNNKIEI